MILQCSPGARQVLRSQIIWYNKQLAGVNLTSYAY